MPETGFSPDWVSPPGETICDILEERHLSTAEFAASLGSTVEYVNDLLRGETPITRETARKLSRILGSSEEFWTSRESGYRDGLARLSARVDHQAAAEWLRALPLKDMVRFGWVDAKSSASDRTTACLRFFGVPSVDAWQETYNETLQGASFRTSQTFTSDPCATAAWLRQGELEAAAVRCERWNPSGFRLELETLRSLTRAKDLTSAFHELQRRCAQHGVAVIVLRAPSGCRASGAARVVALGRRLVQLSFRYLSDDHLWFTFFHEAGHLLLHGDREVFLDVDENGASEAEEREANAFAADLLVPRERQRAMKRLPADAKALIKFAREIGIAPGVVVGQLQHAGRLRPNQMNSLKRRFMWADGERFPLPAERSK